MLWSPRCPPRPHGLDVSRSLSVFIRGCFIRRTGVAGLAQGPSLCPPSSSPSGNTQGRSPTSGSVLRSVPQTSGAGRARPRPSSGLAPASGLKRANERASNAARPANAPTFRLSARPPEKNSPKPPPTPGRGRHDGLTWNTKTQHNTGRGREPPMPQF